MTTVLLGGSFNPVHTGHLQLIEALWAEADKLIVSPVGHNPLKNSENILPASLRATLLNAGIDSLLSKEATAGSTSGAITIKKGLVVDWWELYQVQTGSTLNWAKRLRQAFPNEQNWALAIGEDLLPELEKWKGLNELAQLFEFWIIRRKGFTISDLSIYLPAKANYRKFDFGLPELKARDLWGAIGKRDVATLRVAWPVGVLKAWEQYNQCSSAFVDYKTPIGLT